MIWDLLSTRYGGSVPVAVTNRRTGLKIESDTVATSLGRRTVDSIKAMVYERDVIRRIREAVAGLRLSQPFRASDVNRVLRIDFAGTFLPKHRVGNPGG